MGFFDFLRKKDEPPKAVKLIYKAMEREMEGKKLAEDAISYRNLGNYEKAFSLLRQALTEFGYTPAIILIGTTAVLKGDIDGAIKWFSTSLEEQRKRGDFPLIELYANLGSIHQKLKKYDKAIEMYQEALAAPRPHLYGEEYYVLAVSNVYRDMAVSYYNAGDLSNARVYASKRLQDEPSCDVSKKLIAFCDEQANTKSVVLNRLGLPAGVVEYQPDGRSLITSGENSDFISGLMSIWQIGWDKVSEEDKLTFSRHMALSENHRTPRHREVFAHAMLHFFAELKTSHTTVPEPIAGVIRLLPECVLPPLPRPLSRDVRNILMKVYGKEGSPPSSQHLHPSS